MLEGVGLRGGGEGEKGGCARCGYVRGADRKPLNSKWEWVGVQE